MSKALHPYYLQQMGIESWVIRKPVAQSTKLWVIGEILEINTPAHALFNKMISSIGLLPEDICFKAITDNLKQDIHTNHPPLLLALGKAGIQFLLNSSKTQSALSGKIHTYENTPVIVSYDPIDLLNSPIDKKYAYQDMLFMHQVLAQLP